MNQTSDSPLVTEEWAHQMGFRRLRFPKDCEVAGAKELLMDSDRLRCLVGIEFGSDGPILFVEDRFSGESVVITDMAQQCHVEHIDDMVTIRE